MVEVLHNDPSASDSSELAHESYAAGLLGLFLATDPAFRKRAAQVRDAGGGTAAAFNVARDYVAKGLGRQTIAWYLKVAAEAVDDNEMLRLLTKSAGPTPSMGSSTSERRRRLREQFARTLERGARLLVLRGRGVCLADGCGTIVATTRPLMGIRRRVRADYCDACRRAKPDIAERDKKAIKAVLDGAAARTFSSGPQRPRARILARRRTAAKSHPPNRAQRAGP